MDEVSLYEQILEIEPPWFVDCVEFDKANDSVLVHVDFDEDARLSCPVCGDEVPRYDKRRRRWRHLDTCQYQTYVTSDVPRVSCARHGCLMVDVPWAERGVRFTQLFEARIIDWLQDSSISAVSRRFELSWNAVDRIMQRAVRRGLSRRQQRILRRINVDEVSFKKRHEYATVITDEQGQVVDVQDGHKKASLKGYYDQLTWEQKCELTCISMDMSPAYIAVTLDEIPAARHKIAFDKFHVAMFFTKAVDEVRKEERLALRRLLARDELKGSRFLWLRNGNSLNRDQKRRLRALKSIAVKTGRAWLLKEYAMSIWDYRSRAGATKAWLCWYNRAIRSRLTPIQTAAKGIKKNLWGIVNAIVFNATNAMAESVNSKIKIMKVKARGYRNRERFKIAILFHFGGLNLYP